VPELVLIEITAALAAKTAESVYELVRDKFKGRRKALAALEAADGADQDSPQVVALAEELATAEPRDAQFREQLRAQWAAVQGQAFDGCVANTIGGMVTGNVVQARDITGDISFGSCRSSMAGNAARTGP
jgi:hypothetical protein